MAAMTSPKGPLWTKEGVKDIRQKRSQSKSRKKTFFFLFVSGLDIQNFFFFFTRMPPRAPAMMERLLRLAHHSKRTNFFEGIIHNITGYHFKPLSPGLLPALRDELQVRGDRMEGLLGTTVVSPEGVNVALAGPPESVSRMMSTVCSLIREDPLQQVSPVHLSRVAPFGKFKVKIKEKIVAGPGLGGIPITPAELDALIDAKGADAVQLVDVRNDYEHLVGTFENAKLIPVPKFAEVVTLEAIQSLKLDPSKPVVTFCTGGIRCEKIDPIFKEAGIPNMMKLKGGILAYMDMHKEDGGGRFKGQCFVFDSRVSVTADGTPLFHKYDAEAAVRREILRKASWG